MANNNKSVNKVILVGNVGKDPEVKYTRVVFRLEDSAWPQMNDSRTRAENSRSVQNGTALWPGTDLPRSLASLYPRGSKVYIEGKLQTSEWKDRLSGEKKYRTEIVAKDLVLLGSREKENGVERPRSVQAEKAKSAHVAAAGPAEVVDSDVPF